MTEFKKINRITSLLLARRDRELTDNEKLEIESWLDEDSGNRSLYNQLIIEKNIPARLQNLDKYDSDRAYYKFIQQTQKERRIKITRALRYAAILIPFLFTLYFIYQHREENSPQEQLLTNIQPGSSKAILELEDGSIVNLEDGNKQIAEYDGTIVRNTQKRLIYQASGTKRGREKIKYNTIKIPRGGEYQLNLSDGTKVWLNSETILKYPVEFSDKNREVYMQGEAFFEVTKNADWPFVVHTSDVSVNVLGTSFNVRSYLDESSLATTLVSGKVSVVNSKNKQEYNLLPNQQAIITDTETHVQEVNVTKYVAWKNGRIFFEESTLEEILSDLSRWYNLEVNYADEDVRNLRFSLDIQRYSEFNKIMELIELTKKIKFEINGNELTIKMNL